ncbi:CBS domain-containing protein [Microbispora siamensis]
MTRDPVTLPEEAPVVKAAKLMRDKDVHQLPVVGAAAGSASSPWPISPSASIPLPPDGLRTALSPVRGSVRQPPVRSCRKSCVSELAAHIACSA